MLVLTRKRGEKIQIGNEIELVVVEISGGRVRLGIDCPVRIPVHREEIYRRICAERQHLSRGTTDGESKFRAEFA